MGETYNGIHALLYEEPDAKLYYDELPDYVKEQIQTRGHNVNSYESLKDYAENLLRGDC